MKDKRLFAIPEKDDVVESKVIEAQFEELGLQQQIVALTKRVQKLEKKAQRLWEALKDENESDI